MGKNKKKEETYTDIKTQQQKNDWAYGTSRIDNDKDVTAREDAYDASSGDLRGQYGDWASGANKVDTGKLGAVYDLAMGMAQDGGYDSARQASIMENVAGLKELGRTGGLDAEAMNRMRGLGVFDEYSQTGGINDRDKANLRARALAPIGAYAKNTQNELDRRMSVQGGYGPGMDSASRALRRDAARGMNEASLGAELDITDRVNAGRQWGASNVASSEGNMQTLRTGNMFRGLEGAGQMEMAMQNSINQYKAMGMSQASATAAAMADFELQGKQMGLSGLDRMNQTDASLMENSKNRDLDILNSQTSANNALMGQRTSLSQGGNGAGGIASAILGGFGSIPALFGSPDTKNAPKNGEGGSGGGESGGNYPGGRPPWEDPYYWYWVDQNGKNPNVSTDYVINPPDTGGGTTGPNPNPLASRQGNIGINPRQRYY